MLPTELPRPTGEGVLLRAFTDADLPLVEASRDPLIPLITTVPVDAHRGRHRAAGTLRRALGNR